MNFSLDDIPELIKTLWYISSSIPQSLVLGYCRFRSLLGAGPRMAKLNLKMALLQHHINDSKLPKKQTKFCKQRQQTSELNMVAQVPIHQHTTGLVILPSLMPWQILYSSVPPIWFIKSGQDVPKHQNNMKPILELKKSKHNVKSKNSKLFSHLSQHHYHLDPWGVLVTKDMVHECGAWISVQRRL